MTACGKRLLKKWLARPLYNLEAIKERQDAIADLKVCFMFWSNTVHSVPCYEMLQDNFIEIIDKDPGLSNGSCSPG